MADVFTVTFTGRLTADATTKSVGSTTVTEFDVANNFGYGDKAGVQYIKCTLWGKRGTSLEPYLKKGQAVCIAGQETENKWTGQDGQVHKDRQVNVSDVSLLGGGKKEDSTPEDNPDVTF